MSSVFIPDIGYVAIDSNKSEAEKQATIQYYKDVAPKYKAGGGFMSGMNDSKSMIYRWGQKFFGTEDEERERWYDEQIKEWGELVGVYDSIALAKYYDDIKKTRELNAGEKADNEANTAAYQEFKNDMTAAFDYREGDISDVQKKYGYDQEELGVIEGLSAFASMAKDDPAYVLGNVAGMIVKDPQLLLLGYLGIPARTVQGGIRAAELANRALQIQPKYTQKLGRLMQNSRVQAGVGRGVEGATYGGVYEALYDLTFQGNINPENVERGIAFGALLGTAFGGISGQVGNKNWFLSKTSSEQAAKKIKGKQKPKQEAENIDYTQSDVNPKYRPITPEEVILPEGLSHKGRADLWRTRSLKVLTDAWIKKNPDRNVSEANVSTIHTKAVVKEKARLKKQKVDGKQKYTKDEINGLAQKNVAKKFEVENKIDAKKEGIRPTADKKWGQAREKAQGKNNIKEKKVVRGEEEFSHRFDDTVSAPKEATLRQLGKAAVVGGAVGTAFASEDKGYGAFMGMLAGVAARKYIKGVDVNEAKMRMKFYSAADKSKSLKRMLEMSTGKTMTVVAKILRGKDPKMTHKQFLTFVETYSTKSTQAAMKKLTQEERNAIDAVRNLMLTFKKEAQRYGILKNEQFITDYIAHIFKNKPPKGAQLEKLKKQLGEKLENTTKNQMVRTLNDTIEALSKKKEYAGRIETDVFKILDTYSRSMSKAIAGAHLVNVMKKVGVVDGSKTMGVIVSNTEKNVKRAIEMGYKTVDQPALKDVYVHPLIKNSLEDFFYTSVGSPLLMDKVIALNNALKRVAISLSFFHAQSLVLSAAYAGAYIFTKKGKAKMKQVRALMDGQWEGNYKFNKETGEILPVGNMLPDQVGDFTQAKLLQELADYGVEIGVKANEFVDAGYSSVKAFYDKHLPPIGKAQDWIDKQTWDVMHDQLKVFTYLTAKERAMSSTPRGLSRIVPKKYLEKWRPLTEHEASEMAAKYVNDAFGGQRHTKLAIEWQQKAIENANNPKGALYNWIALATTPSKAKYSQLLLFSPDWTISNIRIAFRGMGMTKDLVTKVAKGGKLNAKEIAEWHQYAGYFVRGLITTSMLAYMASAFMSDEDTPLDLKDFWLRGRVNLGGGEEMVVSKQIAEPMHWLMHPLQTGLNKSATLPKTVAEIFLGKQYISLKHSGYIGPNMDRSNPKEVLSYMAGKLPISVSPWKRLITDDNYTLTDANKAAVLGALGFPIYKRTGD